MRLFIYSVISLGVFSCSEGGGNETTFTGGGSARLDVEQTGRIILPADVSSDSEASDSIVVEGDKVDLAATLVGAAIQCEQLVANSIEVPDTRLYCKITNAEGEYLSLVGANISAAWSFNLVYDQATVSLVASDVEGWDIYFLAAADKSVKSVYAADQVAIAVELSVDEQIDSSLAVASKVLIGEDCDPLAKGIEFSVDGTREVSGNSSMDGGNDRRVWARDGGNVTINSTTAQLFLDAGSAVNDSGNNSLVIANQNSDYRATGVDSLVYFSAPAAIEIASGLTYEFKSTFKFCQAAI